jgi:hypothetical protein
MMLCRQNGAWPAQNEVTELSIIDWPLAKSKVQGKMAGGDINFTLAQHTTLSWRRSPEVEG